MSKIILCTVTNSSSSLIQQWVRFWGCSSYRFCDDKEWRLFLMTRHWQNARTIANSEVRLRIRREPNATTIETQQRLQIARYVFVRCELFFVLNTMLYLINCNLFGIEVSLYRARHRRKRSFLGRERRGATWECHKMEGSGGELPHSWEMYSRGATTEGGDTGAAERREERRVSTQLNCILEENSNNRRVRCNHNAIE